MLLSIASIISSHAKQGNKLVYDWVWRARELDIVIEVGYMHYLFSIERYLDDNGKVVLNPRLIDKFNINKKISNAPLAAISVMYTRMRNEAPKIKRYDIDKKVENPIFSATKAPSRL